MPLLTLPSTMPRLLRESRLTLFTLLTALSASNLGCSDGEVSPASGGAGGASGAAGATSGGAGAGGFFPTAGSSGTGGSSAGGAGGASGGGAGTTTAGAGGGGGGSAPIEASFNTFKSIIPTSCFGGLCHNLKENPLQLTVDDKLYTTLTTHMTETCGVVVKPGSPQDSALVKLLKGPCNGTERMPSGKCFEDGDEGCVPPDYIAAIEKWIAAGAPP